MTKTRRLALFSWRPSLSIVPLVLSGLALALALLPPGPRPRTTVWITSQALAAGTILTAHNLLPLQLAAGAGMSAAVFTHPPIGWHLTAAAPAYTVVSTSTVNRQPAEPAATPSLLVVTIPVVMIPPGLAAHGSVMVLMTGASPPEVLVARAPVVAAVTTSQGSFVSVSLSVPAAQLVEYALAAEKVVVLPWQP